MKKINFRKARTSDVNSIYQVMKSVGRIENNFKGLEKSEIKKKIKSRITKRDRFISVMELDKKVIGYSSFRPFNKFPYNDLLKRKLNVHFAYGAGIAINPKFQGKGFGKLIRELSLEQAKKEGFAGMYVIIEPSNKISLKLHKKEGFSEMTTIIKDNGEKRVLVYKKFR